MNDQLYIKTFGCQMNERDSEIMQQLLFQDGYLPQDGPEGADVILINTCSIREKAAQKVFSLLGQLRDEKANNPRLLLGVTGCVAQQEGARIFERMPHVDLVVGTQQVYQIPALIADLRAGRVDRAVAVELDPNLPIPPFQKLIAKTPIYPSQHSFRRFVNIMQGCNNFCSYCVVPHTRGREISRPAADICEEVEQLVGQGVREITLLGQNVNSYGKTNRVADGPIGFPQLLRQVAAIPGIERLRFTTSHPKDLSEDLMRCFAELEPLCPHFHLPVQSGSNAVLRRMNRHYTIEEYLAKVETLRRYRPDIALFTDIIVGFPGETDADFQATLDLLTTVRFHGSFSFKYSDRPNTRSLHYDDKIDEAVKGRRLQAYQSLQDIISLERNTELIGSTVDVLVESCSGQSCTGRTPTNQVVHCPVPTPAPVPGETIQVRIEHAGKHSLRGRPTGLPCPL
ncbi:MAG: tRNA (N6-isopentenyl adenosine(37)-C2)-methylthiotransferase MiaB [Desulfobulbus sp.]|jgi:tRNA-2-methylthio-N6-dimethylallyladenosine synthase